MQAHVLVVASVTATSEELIGALRARAERGPARFTLVMPATRIGLSARDEDAPALQRALETWQEAGLDADGHVADHDPMDALMEAWDPKSCDELVVSTLAYGRSKWLRYDLPHRAAAYTGAQVTHVVTPQPRPEPAHEHPPRREQSPLGPLAVLAWGGRHDD